MPETSQNNPWFSSFRSSLAVDRKSGKTKRWPMEENDRKNRWQKQTSELTGEIKGREEDGLLNSGEKAVS